VARRAGVGVGTVYRHFPTKEALIEALISESFQAVADQALLSLEIEDPWEAFATLLWRGAEIMAGDRALSEVFAAMTVAMEERMPSRDGLNEAVGKVIERAQAAGVLRPDLLLDDIPMIMCGIGSATKKEHRCPGAWRRYLSIVLDGMRAEHASGSLPE